jgi:hypothetical protein
MMADEDEVYAEDDVALELVGQGGGSMKPVS